MSRLPKILVFDSGAGGLTIGKEMLSRLPTMQLIFASDKSFFPYGEKPDNELIERISLQLGKLIAELQPDIVIIACNTASTIALDVLRSKFTLPFIGVVPAIKPAAKLSKSGVIGLLATPATSNRRYTHKLIEDFAQNCSIIIHGSKNLVTEAEACLLGKPADHKLVANELHTLFTMPRGDQIDTVVLACTHFPLLKHTLTEESAKLGKTIQWVDSGEAIARRVAALLNLPCRNNQHLSFNTQPTKDIAIIDCDKTLDLRKFSKAALSYLTTQ